MEIIREEGDLIRFASKNNATIITTDIAEVDRLEQLADSLDLEIIAPATIHRILEGVMPFGTKRIVFHDAHAILHVLARGVDVVAIRDGDLNEKTY